MILQLPGSQWSQVQQVRRRTCSGFGRQHQGTTRFFGAHRHRHLRRDGIDPTVREKRCTTNMSMDWFCWENRNRKPMVFTIKLFGLSCKFSHHPILWIWSSFAGWLWLLFFSIYSLKHRRIELIEQAKFSLDALAIVYLPSKKNKHWPIPFTLW